MMNLKFNLQRKKDNRKNAFHAVHTVLKMQANKTLNLILEIKNNFRFLYCCQGIEMCYEINNLNNG